MPQEVPRKLTDGGLGGEDGWAAHWDKMVVSAVVGAMVMWVLGFALRSTKAAWARTMEADHLPEVGAALGLQPPVCQCSLIPSWSDRWLQLLLQGVQTRLHAF